MMAAWLPGTPLVGSYIDFAGGFSGILLWPAVVLHVILTALLTRTLISDKETKA